MRDFLADQSGAELSGWLEYLRLDDEIQEFRLARAITMAFKVERKPRASHIDDDEEVIDTTKPEFTEKFKGFINQPGTSVRRPPQGFKSTEIIRG